MIRVRDQIGHEGKKIIMDAIVKDAILAIESSRINYPFEFPPVYKLRYFQSV